MFVSVCLSVGGTGSGAPRRGGGGSVVRASLHSAGLSGDRSFFTGLERRVCHESKEQEFELLGEWRQSRVMGWAGLVQYCDVQSRGSISISISQLLFVSC